MTRDRRDRILYPLSALLVLAAAIAAIALLWDLLLFASTPVNLAAPTVLEVKGGATAAAIGRELAERGLIADADRFRLLARRAGGRIKAGEYRLEPGVTPEGLLALLASGQSVQYSLTLVEGWSFAQVMAAVAAAPELAHTLPGPTAAEGGTAVMSAIGHPGEHPEGRFLPETYHFPRGLSDAAFLRRAYQAMSELLAAEWERRAEGLPLAGPYEALILASIVEKETGAAAERPQIAGVFVRRLQRGMLLQTDPTVIYGLGPAFDGDLRRRDLERDTPYNTYTRRGLPPTPIAMPGRAAIQAALHPADGESLYFVARGDGTHHFSATLAEHNRAVAKFQLGQ